MAWISLLFDEAYCLITPGVMLCGVVLISIACVWKQYPLTILSSGLFSSGLQTSSPEDIHRLLSVLRICSYKILYGAA